MGRARKHSVDTIVQACVDYLENRGSAQSLANQLSVDSSTLRSWILTYRNHGKDAFTHKKKIDPLLKHSKNTWFMSMCKGTPRHTL